jgi:uncharacterized protein (DUF1330 family)
VPAYIVVDLDVRDPQQFSKYQEAAMPTVGQYGGKVIVWGTKGEALENGWAPWAACVIEFEDRAAARRWYDSPEYVAARKHRQGVSTLRFTLVDG